MGDVRKNEQKTLNKDSRLRYKHGAYLLRKSRLKLKDEEKIQLSDILYTSPKLETAYWLKEAIYDVYNSDSIVEAYENLNNWKAFYLYSNVDTKDWLRQDRWYGLTIRPVSE